MSYSISSDETIDQGIRRIYKTCLNETISGLSPPIQNLHEAIHNSRKSFKFLRALVRLLQEPMGQGTYARENQFFRDQGREISELRDLHVMSVVLQFVAREAQSVRPKDIEAGAKKLNHRETLLLESMEEEDRFKEIISALKQANHLLDEIPELSNSLAPLLPGLKNVYQKGKEAFHKAKVTADKEDFHEWRKEVKYLLNHHQVLSNYWPPEVGVNGTSLLQLSDYLGEEHDLAIFDDLLMEETFNENLGHIEAMENYVHQKRSFLQRSALNLGDFIYSKTEDEFISFFK
ncbi:MAG: CHAD domain-containing protein [Balneolaceae bacterium]|nr:CHAD domain-containing protein [Balneolaceae bacterium]